MLAAIRAGDAAAAHGEVERLLVQAAADLAAARQEDEPTARRASRPRSAG